MQTGKSLFDGVPDGHVLFSAWLPRTVNIGKNVDVDGDLAPVIEAAKLAKLPYQVVSRMNGEIEQKCIVVEREAYEQWKKSLTTV